MNRILPRLPRSVRRVDMKMFILMFVSLALTFIALEPAGAKTNDWTAKEGEKIINGRSSGSSPASAPGEVSVEWKNPQTNISSFASPRTPTDTEVDHLSQVSVDTPTPRDNDPLDDGDSLVVEPGDTVDVGFTITNTGNGPDTYALRGRFLNAPSGGWDTTVYLDTNEDSSAEDEPTINRLTGVRRFGQADDDTTVVVRFTIPQTVDLASTRSFAFNSQSVRREDPEPGSDTKTVNFSVSNTGNVRILSPAELHRDTNVRRITVAGTTVTSNSGDSLGVSVNHRDTQWTEVDSVGSWSMESVQLSDMGDTVQVSLYEGDSTTTLVDTDQITVNYDPIADSFPQNFHVKENQSETIPLEWKAFPRDPDTGVGFKQYIVAYDTESTPDSDLIHGDSSHVETIGGLSTNSAKIAELERAERYVFRIGYEDQLGNRSSLSQPDTGLTGTPPEIRLETLRNTDSDSALLANGSDTLEIRATWSNSGDLDGTLRLDTGDLQFHNSDSDIISGFDVDLGTDSKLSVPGNSRAPATWKIQTSDTGNQTPSGAYQVRYLNSDSQAFVNVAKVVSDITYVEEAVDSWTNQQNGLEIKAGISNDHPVHHEELLTKDDQLVLMYQRGDSSYIDTPVVNPDYGFTTGQEFRSTIRKANKKLQATFDRNLNETIMNISIWKENVQGRYLGNARDLREKFQVTIPKPNVDEQELGSDKLKVAKLMPDSEKWLVVDDDPEIGFDNFKFEVSSNPNLTGSGFSIFRLVVGPPVSGVGDANQTIVYPNPFIPYDGNSNTGEYGPERGQGIHFATGKNQGFPAGTELKIYTVSGELVTRKRVHKISIIQWNGRNREGVQVSSGTYVYRISTPDGSEKVGKFSVIR